MYLRTRVYVLPGPKVHTGPFLVWVQDAQGGLQDFEEGTMSGEDWAQGPEWGKGPAGGVPGQVAMAGPQGLAFLRDRCLCPGPQEAW